jgi:TrmH family RNA methyltransferase
VRTIETSESVLAQISKRDNPQTVIGAYKQAPRPAREISGDTIVALEGIRDPGNLGTILRTADSTGAGGVILVGESCDPFSVEAVRASMGSLFAMKLARASFDELLRYKTRSAALRCMGSRSRVAFDARSPWHTGAGKSDRAHGQRAIGFARTYGSGLRSSGEAANARARR